jgi:hypothetical protein
MIEEKKLYPVTILRGLRQDEIRRFGDAGVVTLKQVVDIDEAELVRITRLSRKSIREAKEKSRQILINTDKWPKDDRPRQQKRRPAKRKKHRRRR